MGKPAGKKRLAAKAGRTKADAATVRSVWFAAGKAPATRAAAVSRMVEEGLRIAEGAHFRAATAAAVARLAKVAGLRKLDRDQSRKLAVPLVFLLDRLIAVRLGERSEAALFDGPSLDRIATAPRQSGASRMSALLRQVLLSGVPLQHGGALAGTWSRQFDAGSGWQAWFVWRESVFQPPRPDAEPVSLPSKLHTALMNLLDRRKAQPEGLPTTWGQLRHVVRASRRKQPKPQYIAPFGRGFECKSSRPGDRPAVDHKLAAKLLAFLADEPLLHVYNERLWLVVGPERVFALARTGGALNGPWVRAADEDLRTQPRKQPGKRTSQRPGRETKWTKPIALRALYEMLERLARLDQGAESGPGSGMAGNRE